MTVEAWHRIGARLRQTTSLDEFLEGHEAMFQGYVAAMDAEAPLLAVEPSLPEPLHEEGPFR